MLDFVRIETSTKSSKDQTTITVYPELIVGPSEDLMIRGGDFYAVWDEENHIWSTDPMRVAELVDRDLRAKQQELSQTMSAHVEMKPLFSYSSGKWNMFQNYCKSLPDSYVELDCEVTFADQEVSKEDYVSHRLPYSMSASPIPSYDGLMSTLYEPAERQKIEWAIGSVIAGDSKDIQKFLVFYGSQGTGKSTVLHVIEQLFEGYTGTFDAKAIGQSSNQFALEAFRDNPLVMIQHDGDLSRIEDNTRLNSIVSHEMMLVNEKRKTQYPKRFQCLLFLGTNKPVLITDAKSGILRRLIDVRPTGERVPISQYNKLMDTIPFELGGIATHCLEVYKSLGMRYYDNYKPTFMMSATNDFYTFMLDEYESFAFSGDIALVEAWQLYKVWVDESNSKYSFSKRQFKLELMNYFDDFKAKTRDKDGRQVKNYYIGFKTDIFEEPAWEERVDAVDTRLKRQESIFDKTYALCPAQYANEQGVPTKRWDDVETVLADISTDKLHYVQVPDNHIVIDFDLKNEDGEKDMALNLEAISQFPTTYTEVSQSGGGLHLHYIYDGDVTKLANAYSEGIEIKLPIGKSSLRRKLTLCNNEPISHLSSGLPLKKGGKKGDMLDFTTMRNEQTIRALIKGNIRKKYVPGTKPSIDFIKKILDEAYESGNVYDVSDMHDSVLAFASKSTHWSSECIKTVSEMKWRSEDEYSDIPWPTDKAPIIFFDVEVFPNLFVVVWKEEGEDKDCVQMINPSSAAIKNLTRFKLVGFNNRRYDNHILYARMMGYNEYQLYKVSQKIIGKSRDAFFGGAYGLSYADIYDFASAPHKMSLKKWEIELGIHHQELGLPWDDEVPEDKWNLVAEYCENDVVATEAVWNHLHDDFVAREILASLSGYSVNDPTRKHMTKIIFGDDKNPTDKLVYTDLSTYFPGYTFEMGKSLYRGEEVGEGGYVYAEPGYYENVALLDVASMHPASIIALNYLGPYTQRYADIRQARIYIKHGDYDAARGLLSGALAPFLDDTDISPKDLADALKTALNSLYGYTCASFDCPFKHPKNKDNIVAKRGALFMVDLKNAVQERGYTVVHIKTDSIKIANADQEIIDFVFDYGKEWGYDFEHEATYDKICLVNDAVYIARDKDGWHATGKQFAEPYVFKTMFSHEDLTFEDFCETRSVNEGDMVLDMAPSRPEGDHFYKFVGRAGEFCPIVEGGGGGELLRVKDGKYYAVQKTKGYLWLESETVRLMQLQDAIDPTYHENLVKEAKATIEKFVPYEQLIA